MTNIVIFLITAPVLVLCLKQLPDSAIQKLAKLF